MDLVNSLIAGIRPNYRLKILSDYVYQSRIVLYGAGQTGKWILRELNKHNIQPICIIDDTFSKQGTIINNVKVYSIDHLISINEPFALIVAIFNPLMNFNSTKSNLEKKGVQNIFSFIELSFLFPSAMLPYYHFDTKENLLKDVASIREAFELFKEPASKDIFLNNLSFRLSLNFEVMPVADNDPYFPASVINIPDNSIFFDCGAFDGDTVRSFIGANKNFEKVYAFEPDNINFNRLLRYCAEMPGDLSEKTYAFNYGISSGHNYLKFNSLNNMGSSINQEGSDIIQTIDLDSFFHLMLKESNGEIFIKMDIEGHEPEALKGCVNLIKEKSPQLAISIYHNPDDLWRIPLYINSIQPGYNFLLRQHGNDSMDLVLYAIA